MATITAKAGMMEQLLSSAEARDRTVQANAKQLEDIRNRKLLPLLTENALVEQIFRGKQELALLRAERDTMAQQVAQVIAASRFTDQAIADIQTLFDAGRMRAPMDGYIAGIEVGIGAVVQPGNIVAEMVGTEDLCSRTFLPRDSTACSLGAGDNRGSASANSCAAVFRKSCLSLRGCRKNFNAA